MKEFTTLFCFFCAIVFPFRAGAESARNLVERGNELYTAGSYDEAVEAYEGAAKELPDSAEVLFNKGNAYFRKGDYGKAREAYEAASLNAREPSLEARSQFNLGNTAFAEAGVLLQEDPKKGLDRYGMSIRHYQNALRIDSNLKEAAENIEMARLTVKDLMDRIKNREEQQKERRKQREELKKEIEEAIREQEAEIGKNASLGGEMAQDPGGDFKSRLEKLQRDQDQTRDRTEKIARQLDTTSSSIPQKPEPEMAGHLENALRAQESAIEGIGRSELEKARDDQEKALQEMKQALAKLEGSTRDPSESRGRDESGHQEQQDGAGDQSERQSVRPKEGDQGKQDETASRKAGQAPPPDQGGKPDDQLQKPSQPGREGEDPKALAILQDKPEDILREEKEHRFQFERAHKGGYQPVEKDW